MIIEPIKSNKEEYTCQSITNNTKRLFSTKTQLVIHSIQPFDEEIASKTSLLPESQNDKSNQIRTTLLLIIDSERATAMSSQCKINSKKSNEIIDQLGSYEITIENPLERGTPTLFNGKHFHSNKSEVKLQRKEIDNSVQNTDENNGNHEYSRFVEKIRRKQTISTRKLKNYLNSNQSLQKCDSFDSYKLIKGFTPYKESNKKSDLMTKGYQYLQELFLQHKKSKKKRGKTNYFSELNIRSFNIDSSYNTSSLQDDCVKKKNRANSVKRTNKFNADNKRIPNKIISTTMPNEYLSDNKETQPDSFDILPLTITKEKVSKYSSFSSHSNTLPKQVKAHQNKLLQEIKSSESIVILFNGEEIQVNDIDEVNPQLLQEGVCLLNKSKKKLHLN